MVLERKAIDIGQSDNLMHTAQIQCVLKVTATIVVSVHDLLHTCTRLQCTHTYTWNQQYIFHIIRAVNPPRLQILRINGGGMII